MGTAIIKIKIMPKSPSSNLKEIESKAHSEISREGGKGIKFVQEPIAFGLKAIFVSFEWPEEKELEKLEMNLRKIKEVKSAEICDMRRAIG